MISVVHLFEQTVYILLFVIDILMLGRAVASWLIQDDDSPIAEFLYTVTEPLIYPMRVLLERFDAVKDMPIDIPFFATLILLSVIRNILYAFMI